jgi:hypothetical protein
MRNTKIEASLILYLALTAVSIFLLKFSEAFQYVFENQFVLKTIAIPASIPGFLSVYLLMRYTEKGIYNKNQHSLVSKSSYFMFLSTVGFATGFHMRYMLSPHFF